MKKLIASVLVATMLTGCGQPLTIHNGKQERTYPTVGLFNSEQRSPNMCYEVSIGNVVWSILLIESVVFPIYFIGWSIFNPVQRNADGTCGISY